MYTHQTHTTGQTNLSILHCTPLNQYTTTKGIGIRNKLLFGVEPPIPVPPFPPFCGRQVQFILEGGNTTTFVVPPGVTFIYAECVGGGGNGDDGLTFVGGQGGGGGGYGAAGIACNPGDTFFVSAGGPGVASTFGPGPLVQGWEGGTPTGGNVNIGDYTQDGQDGAAGGTPDGGDGGDAPGGGLGGDGGPSSTNGQPGQYPGGGGGGGGASEATPGTGGAGAAGQVRVTWPSPYGLHHIAHQFHNTGQTNYSIMHCTPLNQYTTTKGIGMRRKYFSVVEAAPSDLRVTQQYAEVFNVDPPTPNIRTTQYYVEILEAPPGPATFAAPQYRRMTYRAAGLAEVNPPEPFTSPLYTRYTYYAASLAASLPPEPTAEGCVVCIGRYKVRVQATCVANGPCTQTQTLLERGLQYCHCNGIPTVPARPFNPEFLEFSLFPPLPPHQPPLPVVEPPVGPPFPIVPPIPPQVPPLPPPCPNNPPTLPITDLGVFHIVNESNIPNAAIDAQIVILQEQIDNSFAPYWGKTCTLVRSDATLFGIGYNIYIRNGAADFPSCGYHIDKFFGFEIIGKVFADECTWEDTLSHEVLEILGDPTPSHAIALGPVVTFMGKQGRFIQEVCDPVSDISYQSNKLSNFVYPSWFIPGSPCPWDRLGVLPGPMTFTAGGFMSFYSIADEKWFTVRGNPPTFGGA